MINNADNYRDLTALEVVVLVVVVVIILVE